MLIKSYKTNKITVGDDLFAMLDKALPHIEENTIVAITSKVLALSQGDLVKNDGTISKEELVKQEADWYYKDDNLSQFGTVIPALKNDILIANAGIDESNIGEDAFLLWPKHLQETTNELWHYLRRKHAIANVGILITDSSIAPLKFGTLGICLTWCGFEALQDYREQPDIFGRPLHMTQKNIVDGFAAGAVTEMGEGSEQTPIATITDVPYVVFQDRPPTEAEIQLRKISREGDLYGKMLTSVEWIKGTLKKNR